MDARFVLPSRTENNLHDNVVQTDIDNEQQAHAYTWAGVHVIRRNTPISSTQYMWCDAL